MLVKHHCSTNEFAAQNNPAGRVVAKVNELFDQNYLDGSLHTK